MAFISGTKGHRDEETKQSYKLGIGPRSGIHDSQKDHYGGRPLTILPSTPSALNIYVEYYNPLMHSSLHCRHKR